MRPCQPLSTGAGLGGDMQTRGNESRPRARAMKWIRTAAILGVLSASGTANAGGCIAGPCCTALQDFRPSTFVCRPASGICDLAESCTGASGLCPSDQVKSSATLCRNIAGGCDVEELCTGSSKTCPDDDFRLFKSLCRAANGGCDAQE